MYVLGSHCKSEDGPTVKALCETFGVVQEIPERLMEACIGVMGSGPAYVSQAITFQLVSIMYCGQNSAIRNYGPKLIILLVYGASKRPSLV